MQFTLVIPAPFNFVSAVRSHGWYQLAPLRWDGESETLHKAERLGDGRVVGLTIRATPLEPGVPGGVSVAVTGRLRAAELTELRARLGWMFWDAADFTGFYALADAEPRLQHCRPQAQGRLLRSTSMFEDVIKTMMTTNIQWSGTIRLCKALVARYGEPGPDGARAFPTAEAIARSQERTLRALGLGYRAPYVLALARAVSSGRLDLEAFKDAAVPTLALRKQLLALPGIGPYAAATLLGLLGRHDFIPIDTEAVSAVSNHFYGGAPVGAAEINAVFEKWGAYKSLAYWFWDYSPLEGTTG